MIGVLVALGAAMLAYMASKHSVSAQYVAIAAGILNAPKGQSDAELRVWATNVVNKYSAIPLPAKAAADLKSGKITLSGEAKDTVRAEGTLTVRP